MERCHATIHGRRVAYRRTCADGPPIVLIHGITQDASTWEPVASHLGGSGRLIAVDLPGHGRSDNPPGDHSMSGYASTVRDLLLVLDQPSATVVGHSLGGGVAMQFSYLFPEMAERLVLIDSGGLGQEVSPLLRAAALPGADPVISLLTTDKVRDAAAAAARGLRRLGLEVGTDLDEVWQGLSKLDDPSARQAFIRTVRTSIGLDGQRVSAQDRLYLAEHVPTLLVWGARDRIIPVAHATAAHEAIPGSELHVLPDAGHFPHLDRPAEVADLIRDFVARTEPAYLPRERWGAIVREASPHPDPQGVG